MHLWDDIMSLLPDGSPARDALRRAHACDASDVAAVTAHCVPWMTDPAAMLDKEAALVRRRACALVAAYLMAVGASVTAVEVPVEHVRALRLPEGSHMRRLCGAAACAACLDDSDDEVWLRDDVPSQQWLTDVLERGGRAVVTAAAAPALPLPPNSAPWGSAHVGVHEAEAQRVAPSSS